MKGETKVSITVSLSDREERFLDKLARGVPPTPAAIQAGYSGPTAARLIHKPHLEATIRAASANLQRVIARIDAENAEATAL